MRHDWKPEHDVALEEAVNVCAAGGETIKRWKFWSAVAGRLLPEVAVSADAARSRWDRLLADRRAEERPGETASDKAWAAVADKVESFEKDQLDYLVEYVVGLQDMVREMDGRLAQMQAEQRRLRELWE